MYCVDGDQIVSPDSSEETDELSEIDQLYAIRQEIVDNYIWLYDLATLELIFLG